LLTRDNRYDEDQTVLITAIEPKPILRILLAEDDALIGLFLAELLESMGCDVCAISATEADTVASAARYRPDVMIIDAHLGSGSGITAVKRILQDGFIPHVFASGDPSSILADMPGAIVIQKPFREAELMTAIRKALVVQATS
jgi:CheY-like chemotaxis protein